MTKRICTSNCNTRQSSNDADDDVAAVVAAVVVIVVHVMHVRTLTTASYMLTVGPI